jgi:hypothetical protein
MSAFELLVFAAGTEVRSAVDRQVRRLFPSKYHAYHCIEQVIDRSRRQDPVLGPCAHPARGHRHRRPPGHPATRPASLTADPKGSAGGRARPFPWATINSNL